MSFRTKIQNIDLEIEQLEFKKDEMLRKAGWANTSNTDGCLWLWRKEISGRTYLVSKATAITIQTWLEEFGPREPQ